MKHNIIQAISTNLSNSGPVYEPCCSTESHCKVMRLTFRTYNFTNKLYVQLAIWYCMCYRTDMYSVWRVRIDGKGYN